MAKTIRYFAAVTPNAIYFRASPTMAYAGVIFKDSGFYGFTTNAGIATYATVEITKAAYASLTRAKVARAGANATSPRDSWVYSDLENVTRLHPDLEAHFNAYRASGRAVSSTFQTPEIMDITRSFFAGLPRS